MSVAPPVQHNPSKSTFKIGSFFHKKPSSSPNLHSNNTTTNTNGTANTNGHNNNHNGTSHQDGVDKKEKKLNDKNSASPSSPSPNHHHHHHHHHHNGKGSESRKTTAFSPPAFLGGGGNSRLSSLLGPSPLSPLSLAPTNGNASPRSQQQQHQANLKLFNQTRALPQVPASRRQSSQNTSFPVSLSTPNGVKLVVNCNVQTTPAKLAQMIASKVPELAGVPSSGILFMTLENGTPVPPALSSTFPIALVPPITKQLEASVVPKLSIVLTPTAKKNVVVDENKVGETVPEEFAAKTFWFQLQLPGGQGLQLQCKGNDTIAVVKNQIVPLSLMAHGIDLLAQMDQYILNIPKVDTGGESMNSNVSFIEACRKRNTIPKLVLMEKPSAFTRKEKESNLLIGNLVGKPLCWTVEELETTTFRQRMTREQYLQRRDHGESVSGLHVNPDRNNIPRGKSKMVIFVTLPLNEVVKGVAVEENESADKFTERVFQKYYARKLTGKSATDFMLKVTGVADYIYGDYYLYQFNYIRKRVESNQKIELVLVERQPEESLKNINDEYSAKEFLEIEDGVIRYPHNEIQSSAHSWDHLTCISIWEMKRDFRFRVIGVENLKNYDGQLFITAGLFHGGELMQPKISATQLVDGCSTPRWYEWVSTEMPMYDIPREARVCFTLFEKKDGVDTPVAWVNFMLFDYKHELKTGVHTLGLWPDAEANPIGTCIGNTTGSVLYVEFDSYPLPVVFPTEPSDQEYHPAATVIPKNPTSFEYIEKIIATDPLYPLSGSDKELLWTYREYYKTNPKGLPKFLSSVPFHDMLAVQEMHKFLKLWAPIDPIDALELLDAKFADTKVREHAVTFLEQLSDEDLLHCLLQLTQVLKYEQYHDCALSRFLLHRALKSPLVGHSLFWYLKSEMHVPDISERYGLLLEVYLRGCGSHMQELRRQDQVLKDLVRIANMIKGIKDSDRKETMLQELDRVKFPAKFQLPLNPRMEASGVILNKCKYMDSKKLPLFLSFSNADTHGSPIFVIFKSGDDLRQDMLTLQMLRLMDGLWRNAGLDLRMSCYGCISTGDGVGMIEVVLNSETTAHITNEAGGASAALFKSDTLANWIRAHNSTDEQYRVAVDNFMRSCAGYCVATYVLGIGDRHNDNVMITRTGKLFHIDFGHFLGNYKKKLGIKRERAPFVLTPDFAFVMGGKESPDFLAFIVLCCDAYNILRKHAAMFINLFAMMLSTGIPELTSVDDISYLRDAFSLDLTDEKAREKFTNLIYESLSTKTTQINNAIHIIAHNK